MTTDTLKPSELAIKTETVRTLATWFRTAGVGPWSDDDIMVPPDVFNAFADLENLAIHFELVPKEER